MSDGHHESATPEELASNRILETMLDELGGRATPPDLTKRVAAELERFGSVRQSLGVAARAEESAPRRARRSLAWVACAAGFVFGVVCTAWYAWSDSTSVLIEVVRGEAEFRCADLRFHCVELERRGARLAVGDRIQSADGAVLRLHPLGELKLDVRSTVEVESMSWTKRDGVLVVGSLAFGAVAGAFTWKAFDGTMIEAGSGAGDAGVSRGQPEPATAGEFEDLRNRIAELEQENSDLRTAAGRRSVEPGAVDGPEEPEQPDAALEFIRAGGHDGALAKLDWKQIGTSTKDLVPLLAELGEAMSNGEEPSLAQVGRISELNASLLKAAGLIVDAGIAGSGVNGAFTHPAIAGNHIAATLAAAGLDLDAGQRERLRGLMDQYGSHDENLRLQAESRDFELETVVAEADYKQRFYDEVRTFLDVDQLGALTSERTDDRMQLGLYGSALMLIEHARPVEVDGPDAVVDQWGGLIKKTLQLDDASGARLDTMVREWVDRFPDGFWDDKADVLERNGMMRGSRVRQAMRRQVELMRSVLREFGDKVSSEARSAFTSSTRIPVPLPR